MAHAPSTLNDQPEDALLRERIRLRDKLDAGPPEADRQVAEQALARVESQLRRRHLPLLGKVHVAAPCRETWDGMEGSDRKRFCALCEKDVHNLSAMTTKEAEAFLQRTKGANVCLTFYRRRDGKIMTSDCEPGQLRTRQRRRRSAWVASGSLLAGGAMACGPSGSDDVEHARVVGAAPVHIEDGDGTKRDGDMMPETGEYVDEGDGHGDGVRLLGGPVLAEPHDHAPGDPCHEGCDHSVPAVDDDSAATKRGPVMLRGRPAPLR